MSATHAPRSIAALVVALLASSFLPVPAAAEEASSLTLFLHRTQGRPFYMDAFDTPGDVDGRGPAWAVPVAPAATAVADPLDQPLLDFSYTFTADAGVPPAPLAPGERVAVTVYLRAGFKDSAADPLVESEQSIGLLHMRFELLADGVLLGSCEAQHTFLGETGYVPFECAFPLGSAADTRDLAFRVAPVNTLAQSWGFGHEGDHASRIVLPVAGVAPPRLDASWELGGRVMAGAPATLRALASGGVAPLTYSWDLGDGATATGEVIEHSFAAAGIHRVTLHVTDAAGQLATSSADVRVHLRDHVTSARVVVAVIDSGINPYHEAFRRPGIELPLSELVDTRSGLAPREIGLTFGDDLAAAREADAATWAGIGYRELVHFRDTNVLAISYLEGSIIDYQFALEPEAPIFDQNGHGTATASTVVHAAPDAIVLSVHTSTRLETPSVGRAYQWVVEQPWIDVVSLSMGNKGNAPAAPGFLSIPSSQRAGWSAGKVLVNSAGNDPSPLITDPTEGAPWVLAVTGTQEGGEGREILASTFYPDYASNFTVVAADAASVAGEVSIGGTSFSAPTVAGTVAAAIQQLRANAGWTGGIEDGNLVPPTGADNTLLRAALNRTARYHPYDGYVAGVNHNGDVAVLPVVPFAEIGWGHVDASLVPDLVATIESGDVSLPGLPSEKALAAPYMQATYASRAAFWNAAMVDAGKAAAEAYASTNGPLPLPDPQDDAGTGTDAPADPALAPLLRPDVVYDGTLLGLFVDEEDAYAVELEAGQTLTISSAGTVHCIRMYDGGGEEVASGCTIGTESEGVTYTVPTAGRWVFTISYLQPDAYRFGFGVDGPAPQIPYP